MDASLQPCIAFSLHIVLSSLPLPVCFSLSTVDLSIFLFLVSFPLPRHGEVCLNLFTLFLFSVKSYPHVPFSLFCIHGWANKVRAYFLFFSVLFFLILLF